VKEMEIALNVKMNIILAKTVLHVLIAQLDAIGLAFVMMKIQLVKMKYIMDLHVLIYVLIKMKIVQNVKEMEIALNVKMNIILAKTVLHVLIAQLDAIGLAFALMKIQHVLMKFIMDLLVICYVVIEMKIVQNVIELEIASSALVNIIMVQIVHSALIVQMVVKRMEYAMMKLVIVIMIYITDLLAINCVVIEKIIAFNVIELEPVLLVKLIHFMI
jgi:hypothetical protein